MKRSLLNIFLSTTIIFQISFTINTAMAQNIIFEDGFESGTLNPDRWTANPAEDGGLVEPVRQLSNVPAIPRNGNYALAMGRSENGNAVTNALDLHLNLSGHEDVTLEFWLRSEFDNTDEDDAIFLSVDGGETFTQVFNLRPGDWGGRNYGLMVVDLGAAAAFEGLELSNQTVVRFQQRGYRGFVGNSSYYADGFFIDDVVVRGAPEYATLPFTEGFEANTLGSSWRVADPYNSDLTAPEAEAQWGFIMPVQRITDVPEIPRSGEYALAMGRISNASENGVNAVDLHLDLSNQNDVTLEFWLRSEFDNTDEDDAIYFSDDGGINFTEVFSLSPASLQQRTYEEYILNLSALALENDLEMTGEFVVRFQQRGERGFVGNSSYYADGFFIDDLSVTAGSISGGNGAPVLAEIADVTENELNPIVFTVTATYDGENELEYSLGSNAPEGASIDAASGEFSWTPSEEQGPADYSFTIIVSDGESSDEQEITITVNEVNQAPEITSAPVLNANTGELYEYQLTATDADLPANTLTYEATELPSWLSFEAATQMLSGTPDESLVDDAYFVSLLVSDGEEAAVQEFTVQLNAPTGLFGPEQNSPFVLVYPNPSTGQIIIELENNLWGEQIEVSVFGLDGSLLWSEQAGLEQGKEKVSAYLQTVNEGIYLLQIKAREQMTSVRIIRN